MILKMEKIRLILVDDHQLVRTGIANLLAGEPGFEIIGEAEDANDLFGLLKKAELMSKWGTLKPHLLY